MQAMNTDQQIYYHNPTGPHQATTAYYITNAPDPQYSIRNPNTFAQPPRMPQQFYNPQMSNAFGQRPIYLHQSYLQNPPFVHNGQRGMNPSYNIPVIRPQNENSNATHTYIPQPQYHAYQQPQTLYNPQQYPSYQMQHTYTQPTSPPPISNQSQSPSQYSGTNSHPQTQSPQTSQQSSHDQQHGPPSQSSQPRDKREKKPLAIVDPVSHKPLELETSTPSLNVSSTTTTTTEDSVTDSTIPKSKSTDELNKSQIQEEFRQQVARLLNKPDEQADKNANQSPTEELSINENQTEDVTPQSPSSASSSRSGSISDKSSEQSQPGHPGILTESVNEDDIKQDENNSQNQIETASIDSKSTSDDTTNEINNQMSPTESLENITPTQSNDTESESITIGKTPSISKRHGYTIDELRSKRFGPIAQERPDKLKEIPGVTTPKGGKEQFRREVTLILNKVTPQKYDVLLKQLDALELNSAERLEVLITVIFIKAVEAAIFCSLYANLCKHFQKRQVTVPNESGQPVTYYFRQILLTRCQKEFENDYRQEIEYEKRKAEVEAITDEKKRQEAAEQLDEDLGKAKRKKLGNIIFIGELFKLQMLTAPIMYDCITYLLRDKTDEESLECLCRLLRTIGKELDTKAAEKAENRRNLEKNYIELDNIIIHRQTSTRMRFMIQDLLEMRKANWVARRVEAKPTTIDEIHEQERIKREQQERERHQHREHNRGSGGGGGGGGPHQYTESRGSRGSGVKQQSSRTDEDRNDNRVIVDSLRQIQTNDKRNQGPTALSFAPPRPWGKGSGVEKKSEDDRSNTGRTGKPPAGHNNQFRPKSGTSPGTPGYPVNRQASRELARENSQRDRENAMHSLRKTTNPNEKTSPNNNTSITNSREGSRNVSREESRNTSPESSVNERTLPTNKPSTIEINTSFNEEKIQARVHSLIEEYTENYSDNNNRPVDEAIEDLLTFPTENTDQQAIVVRELFTNVLEGKPRARKAVGHLLDAAFHKNIISTEGFLSGIKIFIEVVPDYAVDIPLIWQYIGEIIGAFIGGPSSNMILLKPILQSIPDAKSKQLFQDIIRYAIEFFSKAHIQKLWQSADFSLNDLIKSDSSFLNEYNWLTEPTESESTTIKEKLSPHADPQLVKLFKSINGKGTTVTDEEILSYIRENMNANDNFYFRNIVLSYLEACLINRDSQKKIQEDIAKERMSVLQAIIKDKPEEEIQAVYAIQNFVHKLEHPPEMARLLFDIFYDGDCVSEGTFFEWLKHPDQSETEGRSVVEMSTNKFFIWLEQADTEEEEEES